MIYADNAATTKTSAAAQKAMLDAMERDVTERFAGKEVHLGAAYTCSDQEALAWKQEIQERFPGRSIHMDRLSLSVSCHIGPGSMAITCSQKIVL